jgi:FMN phosphatase YigB (HAD superfamily)
MNILWDFDGTLFDTYPAVTKIPRKPDAASYKYLHEKYEIHLAIGDREIDILPAKSLGIKTCLFQKSTPGADFYLSEYRDFFQSVHPLAEREK